MQAMNLYTDKEKIREYYDVMSPYYSELWGEHIHHGYWIEGNESREAAQIQLVEHLAKTAGIPVGCKILDVGCGMGASSIYLARHYHAQVTGITISPVQVKMATRAAAEQNVPANFLVMDAEAMDFPKESFDVLWSVESISHYKDVRRFFASAAKLVKNTGTLAVIDWFRRDDLSERQHAKFIAPIEQSMLVKLHTMDDYHCWIEENGLGLSAREVLNEKCGRTWDISLEILKDKKLWALAARLGPQFVTYLRGFRAMRAGYASGTFVYGLLVARKA
jgi:tocopherol O-methyltransferase